MQDLDKRWARNFDSSLKRLELKERGIAHMGGKCQVCGYAKHSSAFDFHHIDMSTKDFNISGKMRWESILAELEKCVLLCSNCHREVHAGLHPHLLAGEETNEFEDDYCYVDYPTE